MNAVDRVETLAQPHCGTIYADPIDAQDFDIQAPARAIKRGRVVRIGAIPDLTQRSFSCAVGSPQNAAHTHIIVELVVDLAITDVAKYFRFYNGLVFCNCGGPNRGLGKCKASRRIIGHDDGWWIDVEQCYSRRTQTAQDAKDQPHEAEPLPRPLTAKGTVDEFFFNDFLFTRHA